ncbi:MAG: hypothetical protein HY719_05845 [Planctomycetes bacterium]|nr:hypothetical protein [Planctomycetota bacterium]
MRQVSDFFFSDRGYLWKVAATLAAIVLLGHWSDRLGRARYPDIGDALFQPEQCAGREVFVPKAEVRRVDAAGFTVAVATLDPIRVEADLSGHVRESGGAIVAEIPAESPYSYVPDRPVRLEPGALCSLTGTFAPERRAIQLGRVIDWPAGAVPRWLVYAVSVVVVAGVALGVARRYRLRSPTESSEKASP